MIKSNEKINIVLQQVIEKVKELGIEPSNNINPTVRIIDKKVKYLGRCSRRNNEYIITINSALFEATDYKKAVIGTLFHEVLHTCYKCMNHGVEWKHYANMIKMSYNYDISRVTSVESIGLEYEKLVNINHIVKCEKCGREIKYTRAGKVVKHPELYKCQCGGEIKRIK